MFSLTSSEYSGGTRSARRRPTSSTRSTPTKLANCRLAYRIDLAMHQHRLVDAITELGEQPRRMSRLALAAAAARVSS